MSEEKMLQARLPIALRSVSPGEGFTRMEIPEREGGHTGGVYLAPDGQEVWKPLDGRPDADADFHLPTHEETVLRLMAGTVGFPQNWRVEEADGRRWLVRKLACIIPETYERIMLTLDTVLQVERAVRALNAKKWVLNGELRVAIDPDTYEPFLLGLATVQPGKGPEAPLLRQANDFLLFERWASEVAGFEGLILLRRAARKVARSIDWLEGPYGKTHAWVYGSEYRPIDSTWASIPDAVYLHADKAATGVWTWVVVPEPMSDDLLDRYQLRWGYGPVRYEESRPEDGRLPAPRLFL